VIEEAQIGAAARAVREATLGIMLQHGATATIRALAAVLLEYLVAAYGETEAQAVMAGFASDVPGIGARWRLVEQRPAGHA
jgi:hypothetical protein